MDVKNLLWKNFLSTRVILNKVWRCFVYFLRLLILELLVKCHQMPNWNTGKLQRHIVWNIKFQIRRHEIRYLKIKFKTNVISSPHRLRDFQNIGLYGLSDFAQMIGLTVGSESFMDDIWSFRSCGNDTATLQLITLEFIYCFKCCFSLKLFCRSTTFAGKHLPLFPEFQPFLEEL